ncbi:MAG: endonuclease/exonuclease/phosphatase family protein [Desulfococcaceae bacterium]
MIRLLNLNLRFGLAGDREGRSWSRRKTALPHLFAQANPDFLCFQEVNDFQAADLAGLLPGYSVIGRREPAPKFWQHNLIFHRNEWRCRAKDRFFLSPTPDVPSRFRDSRWPRQCTMGRFVRGETEVICATTHFDFLAGVQRRSAEILLKRLTRFGGEAVSNGSTVPSNGPAAHGEPPAAILAGDFNATPDSPAHHYLTREGGFRHAFSPPFPATYHGFSGNTAGEHIDWTLYRGPLRVAEARAVQETEPRPAGDPPVYPSDHFPLWVVFAPARSFIS